jgi:hypothetical protein
MWCIGGWRERLRGDVPFEFICEIARARALAEAGHVEGGAAAARHVDGSGVGEKGGVVAVGDGCGGRGGWWWLRESGMADGRIKTEVDGRKELLARCKRDRFESLLGRNRGSSSHVQASPGTPRRCFTRVANGSVKCFEKFVFTRPSTRK